MVIYIPFKQFLNKRCSLLPFFTEFIVLEELLAQPVFLRPSGILLYFVVENGLVAEDAHFELGNGVVNFEKVCKDQRD